MFVLRCTNSKKSILDTGDIAETYSHGRTEWKQGQTDPVKMGQSDIKIQTKYGAR